MSYSLSSGLQLSYPCPHLVLWYCLDDLFLLSSPCFVVIDDAACVCVCPIASFCLVALEDKVSLMDRQYYGVVHLVIRRLRYKLNLYSRASNMLLLYAFL